MSDVHNAIHRFGNLIAGVRRMVGGGADVAIERLGETLTPVINPWERPEWYHPRGERLLAVHESVGAGAATFNSGAAIVNPAGSNMIVVVTNASVIPSAASAVFMQLATEGQADTAFATDAAPDRIDTRSKNARSVFKFGNINSTSVGVTVERVFHTSRGVMFFQTPPVVLSPGFALVVLNDDDAASVEISFRLYERAALPGELD